MKRILACIVGLLLICGCKPSTEVFDGGSTGACCYNDGTCAIKTEPKCTGTYQGNGTTCDPNTCPQPSTAWACCNFDGTCTMEFEVNCDGGWIEGVDCSVVTCTQMGACCATDGTCSEVEEAECSHLFIPGIECDVVTCTPVEGACCPTNGHCYNSIEADCDGNGSTWIQGQDCAVVTCTPTTGACCSGSGCTQTRPAACKDNFLGLGTLCENCP